MQTYLTATRQMVREGRYAEALERTVWFHEHALEHQPSMAGVRLSFALSDWERLGAVYPAAMTALNATVDSTRARLLRNPADRLLFLDMAGFNRHFNTEGQTIELFERIAADYPDAAAQYWRVVVRTAIEATRLDLLQKYGVDLPALFDQQKALYERSASRNSGNPALDAQMRSSAETNLVSESLALIQTALDLGQPETAKTIQTRALELVNHERLRAIIP